jgi:hypothetical protein
MSAAHIREQFADTGSFTDHVFAACAILGYRFALRIRDLPSNLRRSTFALLGDGRINERGYLSKPGFCNVQTGK